MAKVIAISKILKRDLKTIGKPCPIVLAWNHNVIDRIKMIKNQFELSVSTSCFKEKNGIKWGNVRYQRKNLTVSEFVPLVRQGYCFCQCFHTNQVTFGVREKRDCNFDSAQMVFVDVDDSPIPMAEFIGKLSQQPTVAYTTPNNHTAKSNWLYRFRLCYLLDEPIRTIEEYSMVYDGVLQSIYNDIPTFTMKDNCGRKAGQQFGGNALPDCELIDKGIVHSLSDFPFQNNNVSLLFLQSLLFSNGKTRSSEQDVKITDKEFVDDVDSPTLTYTTLLDKYRERYRHFDHTELQFDNGYALIPQDYQEIYRAWHFVPFEKDNGEVLRIPKVRKYKDGEGRRKKLYIAGLIMKKIMPTITYEHLLYNLIYEVYHFYDNSDNVLNRTTLKGIAKAVFLTSVEDITLQSMCKKTFVVDKSYCVSHGISANSYKNTVHKILKDEEIGSVYDCSKSIKENLNLLHEMGIKVGKTKLYEWRKDHGIATKGMSQKQFSISTSIY